MAIKKEVEQELNLFLDDWEETPERSREVFLHLKECLNKKDGVTLSFVCRPAVTYSLRAVHKNQKRRELFVMVDVIDEDPRWISICFYGEMINDPKERGEFAPGGLLGEDAVCFDVAEWDDEVIRYLEARLDEAYQSAAEG